MDKKCDVNGCEEVGSGEIVFSKARERLCLCEQHVNNPAIKQKWREHIDALTQMDREIIDWLENQGIPNA